MLARAHPYPADFRIRFRDYTHAYTVDGVSIGQSCTSLVHECFPKFDAQLVVDTYFRRWKANGRYSLLIAESNDDDDAKARIIASWGEKGRVAADRGTRLHLWAETFLNQSPSPTSGLDIERRQIAEFLQSPIMRGMAPHRTELATWWEHDRVPVAAGRVDALFRNHAGEFLLVDWKCVAKPLTRADASGHGTGPLHHLKDTTLVKYSLQASLYSEMLKCSHGIDTGPRMLLVAVHRSQPTHTAVKCLDLRPEARAILNAIRGS
jgi:ATP-dependent exoDNAse (exonuclease V) beta subunit